jgi:biopolymer transport protein ExbD
MKTKYGVKLTGEDVSRFGNISSFGDSIKSLKHFINNFRTITEKDMQGIPIDETKKNEFSNWLSEIQSIDQNNNRFRCKFQIDADQAETYHIIELVIRNLQFHDINQFNLLTQLAMRSRS